MAYAPVVAATRSAGEARRAGAIDSWLDAAPFRAHARHLMAAGGLTSAELAVLAGVSLRAVRHLVYGRTGRPARRISPHTARRLFLLTPLEASLVRSRLVPAARTRTFLGQLFAAGWQLPQLAAASRLPPVVVEGLLTGRLRSCTQLVALRVAAAATAAEPGEYRTAAPAAVAA